MYVTCTREIVFPNKKMVDDFVATFDNTEGSAITIGAHKISYTVSAHLLILNGDPEWVSTIESDANRFIDDNADSSQDIETAKFVENRAERRRKLSMAKRNARKTAKKVYTEKDAEEAADNFTEKFMDAIRMNDSQKADVKEKVNTAEAKAKAKAEAKAESPITDEERQSFTERLRKDLDDIEEPEKFAAACLGSFATGAAVAAGLRVVGIAAPPLIPVIAGIGVGCTIYRWLDNTSEDHRTGQQA